MQTSTVEQPETLRAVVANNLFNLTLFANLYDDTALIKGPLSEKRIGTIIKKRAARAARKDNSPLNERRVHRIAQHAAVGRSYVPRLQSRKVHTKTRSGKVIVSHDRLPYQHSSTAQHDRYARQIAAGQIKFIPILSRTARLAKTIDGASAAFTEAGKAAEGAAQALKKAAVRKPRAKKVKADE